MTLRIKTRRENNNTLVTLAKLFSSSIIVIDYSENNCLRILSYNFRFIILSVVSGVALVYSAAVILLPSTRETILKRRFRFGTPTGVEALVRKTQVRCFS